MFGLPGQTVDDSLHDLETAVRQLPTHISWYQLTIEPNTVFNSKPPKLPHEDAIWNMQEQGQVFLDENNYKQYEISAYAKPKHAAVHNLNYWEFGDYLGIGAGAHGKLTNVAEKKIERFARHKIPKRYIELAGTDAAITEKRTLIRDELPLEFMMNALRLTDGIETQLFSERTGMLLKSAEKELQQAEERGLIDWQLNHLKPTLKGKRYLNELLEIFVK
jgi:oxygen-independent coproporphyrinogen-3 oxidase